LLSKISIKQDSGFSLIEVLLVLALIGVMAAIVAGNAGAFIQASGYEPPVRVLKKAVLDAYYFAGERKEATFLAYLEENASFIVSDSSGNTLETHSIFKNLKQGDELDSDDFPEIEFRAIGPLAGGSGGNTIYRENQLLLKRIRFHSGSSVPFEAIIRHRGEEQEFHFDPFSGFVLSAE
jgi:prepilin-type N-terminal cleavage/methylation domain-containing protein